MVLRRKRWLPWSLVLSLLILVVSAAAGSTLSSPRDAELSHFNAQQLASIARSTIRTSYVALSTRGGGSPLLSATVVDGRNVAWYVLSPGSEVRLTRDRFTLPAEASPQVVEIGCSYFNRQGDGTYWLAKNVKPILGGQIIVESIADLDRSALGGTLTSEQAANGERFSYRSSSNSTRVTVQVVGHQARNILLFQNGHQLRTVLGDFGRAVVETPPPDAISHMIIARTNIYAPCRGS